MGNIHITRVTSNISTSCGKPWSTQNQGISTNMIFWLKHNKYVGYSQESIETTTSSNTSFGLILDMSAFSIKVGVERKWNNPS